MTFAVVGEGQTTIGGRVTGFASSAKAELTGLIAAVTAAPKDQDIHIRLDNESVVKQFKKIITNRATSSARDRIRCNNYMDWSALATICQERTGLTQVSWVPGHSGEEWNEKADRAAKDAQMTTDKTWTVDEHAQSEIRYTAQLDGTTLECDARTALE
ncbi:hypothetical protein BGX33_001571, partial [Mortierella sp. NVP41]